MQDKDHGMLLIEVFVKGNNFRLEGQELYDLIGPSSVESSQCGITLSRSSHRTNHFCQQ